VLFTWTDGYSIGIETTDAQHRKIFELINDLYEAMQDGSSSSILKPLMHTVKDYTVTLFALEERYMLEAGDPDLGAHRQKHLEPIDKVDDLVDRLPGGEAVLSVETLLFLRSWLKTHISGTDMKMALYLKEKRLE
jgi:hemerythrin-like metal-binding protein